MTHLVLSYMAAYDFGDKRHAQEIMKSLDIKYVHATPQSMGDCWQFWNCTNLPDELPPYLSKFDVNPLDYVGWGLSQKDAEKIIASQV